MRRRSPPLLLLLLLLLSVLHGAASASGFRICAYNVQRFNSAKAANPRVLHTLTRIVASCDITLLQEVMDSDASRALLTALNRYRYDDFTYQSVTSQSLGKSPSNMQHYVFFYRKETVKVLGEHQYQKKQSFVREPFAVQFHSDNTTINKFVLVALHTEPGQVVQEIDRLYDVYQDVIRKWKNQNVMLLGDFNAGCSHLNRANKKKIRIFTNSSFSWLIGDRVDTTVSEDTSCPYDRIVVHGETFLKGICPLSAKVFNIMKEFRLTKAKVQELSDHLPVEVRLKSSALLPQATPLTVLIGVSVIVQSFLSAL